MSAEELNEMRSRIAKAVTVVLTLFGIMRAMHLIHLQAAVRETPHCDKKKDVKNSKQVVFKVPSFGFVIDSY
jgi:hypothetical protein